MWCKLYFGIKSLTLKVKKTLNFVFFFIRVLIERTGDHRLIVDTVKWLCLGTRAEGQMRTSLCVRTVLFGAFDVGTLDGLLLQSINK